MAFGQAGEMVSSVSTASVAVSLLGSVASSSSSGGINIAALYGSSSGGGTTDPASMIAQLKLAEQNEAQQTKQVADDPVVQRNIAHFTQVVENAKSLNDVLNDPVAREVLLKANGLGDQVDAVGMAQRVLMSNPNDSNSVAQQLSSTNGAWLQMVQTYDFFDNGLSSLQPNNNGFTGNWNLTTQQNGQSATSTLVVTKTNTGYTASVGGAPATVSVTGDTMNVMFSWKDSAGASHLTSITGKVGSDGSLSGAQTIDGASVSTGWTATSEGLDAIKTITNNYIGEKRLDNLDAQVPGLGNALLFQKSAPTLNTVDKILGSAVGRQVVTVAFNIPQQIATQEITAQETAISSRLDPTTLSDPSVVERLLERYLINNNSSSSSSAGVTI